MNKLNTFLSFVLLSFCLLINVSYAEFSSTPITDSAVFSSSSGYSNTFDGITSSTLRTVVKNYIADSTNLSYKDTFDATMLQLTNAGYKVVIITNSNSKDGLIYVAESNVSLGANASPGYFSFYSTYIDSSISTTSQNLISRMSISSNSGSSSYVNFVKDCYYQRSYPGSLFYSNTALKLITYNGGPTWDGTSYYYEVPSDEPSTPSMPTNSEIASAVQLFYNSVYQLPNISFDDFIVLYDTSTGNYLYIGHTRGNALGQVIVEPNGYYDGFKSDVQWWKFFLDEQEDAWNWQNISKYNNYYLYTSKGSVDTLENVGQGKISELLSSGPWATSTTIIVYSTTDYPVKYVTFTEDSPDPNVQTGTIKGDQYTYDEDLDITDNQYNPLDSFVTIDYPSTLVSRADFEGFISIFNENQEILILPPNTGWITLSCIRLFDYFGSFIIMCTFFIIIERVMRG